MGGIVGVGVGRPWKVIINWVKLENIQLISL